MNLAEDIEKLHANDLVDSSVKDRVKKLKTVMPFQKVESCSTSVPVYKKKVVEDEEDSQSYSLKSQYVEVTLRNKETIFIRKQTAVWLFQDAERLSSDRIFRVRAKQPGDKGDSLNLPCNIEHAQTVKAGYIVVGDLCAFRISSDIGIGRVLQFIRYDRNGKQLGYRGNYADVNENIGVMFTWYKKGETDRVYNMCASDPKYHPISTYLCTLTKSCIQNLSIQDKVMGFQPSVISIDDTFTLSEECAQYLTSELVGRTVPIEVSEDETVNAEDTKQWVKCGGIILSHKDKLILMNGKMLTDMHINAAQQLLKQQFQHLNGLQSTLYQLKRPIENTKNAIQILHVGKDHWAVLSSIGCTLCNQVRYYDSAYTSLSADTEQIISHLIWPSRFNLHDTEVHIMMMSKQVGCTECGRYAIAVSTALAFGEDPSQLVFNQEDMRAHLADCLAKQKMKLFPVQKTRRISNPIITSLKIFVCPVCEQCDDGNRMVQCESCNKWHHDSCVPKYDVHKVWLCPSCCTSEKQ